ENIIFSYIKYKLTINPRISHSFTSLFFQFHISLCSLINYVTLYFLNIKKVTNRNRVVTIYLDRNGFHSMIGCEKMNIDLYGLLVVITTSLMGSAFAIGKVGLAYASTILLVSLRCIIEGVLVGIFVWFWKRPHP